MLEKNSVQTKPRKLQTQKTSSLPPIDVIVITHDHLDLTIPCIELLYENTKAPFHLIVIDDSQDVTPEYFAKLKKSGKDITFYHQDEPFKCGNQIFNIGLGLCKYEYVATVMNSVRVEPDWEIVALQIMAMDSKIGIIGFKSIFPHNGLIESAGIDFDGHKPIDIGRGMPAHRFTQVSEPPSLQWAFALLRKEAVVGNLDENVYHGFVGWDDIDNTMVLKKKGWKAIYCGMGAGYHLTHATRGSDNPSVLQKNKENAEIFYKRWGLWDLYVQSNPLEMIRRDIAELKAMVLAIKNDNGKGKLPEDIKLLEEVNANKVI